MQTWTDHSIVAIIRNIRTQVQWPPEGDRGDLKARIMSIYGLPNCLGFIDGSHICWKARISSRRIRSYETLLCSIYLMHSSS